MTFALPAMPLIVATADVELAKLIGILIVGAVMAAGKLLKNRSQSSSVNESDEATPPKPATPGPRSSPSPAPQSRRLRPPSPIAGGPIPLDSLLRESTEQDRRRRKHEKHEVQRRSRADEAQRLAKALQQNALLKAARAEPAASHPPAPAAPHGLAMIGTLHPASMRRAIILNEVLGPPLALRESPL